MAKYYDVEKAAYTEAEYPEGEHQKKHGKSLNPARQCSVRRSSNISHCRAGPLVRDSGGSVGQAALIGKAISLGYAADPPSDPPFWSGRRGRRLSEPSHKRSDDEVNPECLPWSIAIGDRFNCPLRRLLWTTGVQSVPGALCVLRDGPQAHACRRR